MAVDPSREACLWIRISVADVADRELLQETRHRVIATRSRVYVPDTRSRASSVTFGFEYVGPLGTSGKGSARQLGG
jgi:hypothetical protein